MNPFELLGQALLLIAAAVFGLGFMLAQASGTWQLPRRVLISLNVLYLVLLVVGLLLTKGFLVFLMFQYIGLVLVLDIVYVAGAASGAGLRAVQQRKRATALDATMLDDYMDVTEFAAREGIEAERALARIKSGYYKGGCRDGRWYVHRSELTPAG